MQHRLGIAHRQLLQHPSLVTCVQSPLEELRLRGAQQAGQGDGGAHIRERVVRFLVQKPVRGGELFELETGFALEIGPADALRAQQPREAHHIDQVPAGIAVAKLALVRVVEVAVQAEARELVIEAQRVVAHAAGAGCGELGMDARDELRLGQALGVGALWGDAVHHERARVREIVLRLLAENIERFADLVQLGIGADAGELDCTVERGITAEGLVVVPVEARRCRHAVLLSARRCVVRRCAPARASGRWCAPNPRVRPPPR